LTFCSRVKMSKNPIADFLRTQKPIIEEAFDANGVRVYRLAALNKFIEKNDLFRNNIPYSLSMSITKKSLINFLLNESFLSKINLNMQRRETLFVWRSASEYELMPVLRPSGYFSHLSAMHFNELLGFIPHEIFFNSEQPARPIPLSIEQGRIDNAFRGKQRLSQAKTDWNGKVLWFINGKQTGNFGVVEKDIPPELSVRVTNIERTLIDAVVRPAYSGGVKTLLRAFELAKPKLSIGRLAETLRAINFIYPYQQAIGFYLERTGYDQNAIDIFMNFSDMRFDFYLDYGMENPCYSDKWRLYYPSNLDF